MVTQEELNQIIRNIQKRTQDRADLFERQYSELIAIVPADPFGKVYDLKLRHEAERKALT